MSRFNPATFEEAAANRAETPQKPRKPMSRGTRGLNKAGLRQNLSQSLADGKPPTALKRGNLARGRAAGAKRKGKRPEVAKYQIAAEAYVDTVLNLDKNQERRF